MKGISDATPPAVPTLTTTPPELESESSVSQDCAVASKAAVAAVQPLMVLTKAQIRKVKSSLSQKWASESQTAKQQALSVTASRRMTSSTGEISPEAMQKIKQELLGHQARVEAIASSGVSSGLGGDVEACLALITQVLLWLTRLNDSEEDNLDFLFTVRQVCFSCIGIYCQCPSAMSQASQASVAQSPPSTEAQLLARMLRMGITGAEAPVSVEDKEESSLLTTSSKGEKKGKRKKHHLTRLEQEIKCLIEQGARQRARDIYLLFKEITDAIKADISTMTDKMARVDPKKGGTQLLGVKAVLKGSMQKIEHVMALLNRASTTAASSSVRQSAKETQGKIEAVFVQNSTSIQKIQEGIRTYSAKQVAKILGLLLDCQVYIYDFGLVCLNQAVMEDQQGFTEPVFGSLNYFQLTPPEILAVNPQTQNLLKLGLREDLRALLFSARAVVASLLPETASDMLTTLPEKLEALMALIKQLLAKGISKSVQAHVRMLVQSFEQTFGSTSQLSALIQTHQDQAGVLKLIVTMLLEFLQLVFDFHEALKNTQETQL